MRPAREYDGTTSMFILLTLHPPTAAPSAPLSTAQALVQDPPQSRRGLPERKPPQKRPVPHWVASRVVPVDTTAGRSLSPAASSAYQLRNVTRRDEQVDWDLLPPGFRAASRLTPAPCECGRMIAPVAECPFARRWNHFDFQS